MTLKRDLNKLIDAGDGRKTLANAGAAQAIPAAVGAAGFVKGTDFGDSAGIVPPLTEQSRTTKTVTITVPDGTTSIDIEVITQLNMVDDNGKAVVLKFASP